jgi:hypothetical protein
MGGCTVDGRGRGGSRCQDDSVSIQREREQGRKFGVAKKNLKIWGGPWPTRPTLCVRQWWRWHGGGDGEIKVAVGGVGRRREVTKEERQQGVRDMSERSKGSFCKMMPTSVKSGWGSTLVVQTLTISIVATV